jgi:hypothetical protein
MRRFGSRSIRTCGARSNYFHSLAHLRRIARKSASFRFTVALLQADASFFSVIESIVVRANAVTSNTRAESVASQGSSL